MRHIASTLLSVFLAGTIAHSTGNAQTVTQAETFIRAIYRQYDIKSPRGPDFLGRNRASVFSPSLVALIRRDQRQARGEVGKLDGDPICDCQDPDGLRLTSLRVTKDTEGTATAQVTLRSVGDSSPQFLTLRLIWLPRGWRINDIGAIDMPSLRKLLE